MTIIFPLQAAVTANTINNIAFFSEAQVVVYKSPINMIFLSVHYPYDYEK